MEREFVLKSSGEEIKVGDVITLRSEVKKEYGVIASEHTFTINEEDLEDLIKAGMVIPKKVKQSTVKPSEDIAYYIQQLAKSLNWPYEKTLSYLDKLLEIYAPSVLALLARVVAVNMDERYKDHISESKEIWGISLTNGEILPISKNRIVSYDNFAAFRTKKDAKLAKKILSPIMKNMYGEQENH